MDKAQDFSQTPVFSTKPNWNLPNGNLCSEVFLSQVEHELFEITRKDLKYSEWSTEKGTNTCEKYVRKINVNM